MDKRMRDLSRIAKRYGLTVDVETGKHVRLRDASGRVVATASRTPSDANALQRIEADLRKYPR